MDENKSLLRFIGLQELSRHGARGILAFWMLMGMSFFLFADQNLIAPNLKNIGASLGLTEPADIDWYLGGVVPIFFFILGGAVSVSMGYLSQKYSRKHLLIATVILGEVPCLLTGYATSYNEFLLLRTLCGFGLGGIFPLLFSLIGDYFTDKSRAIATGFVSISMGLGVGVGQLVGGILGDSDPINGWRTSFIVLAIPSFFFAFIYMIFCSEPKRGGMEKELENRNLDELSHLISWSDFALLFKNKTNLGVFLQGIPGCVPWGVFFVFLADFYENMYSLTKLEAAGLVTFSAIGVFAGLLFGGIIGQWLYNKNKVYQPIFCGVTTFLGIFPCIGLLYANDFAHSGLPFILLNVFAGFLISLTGANVRAVLINVNVPKRRSAIFSLYNLTDDLGKGLGPAMSAMILAISTDRALALSISILFWIPCSLFWIIIGMNYKKDVESMHEELKNA
ncbi:MFS transporter [Leptospira sp. GIMC2001]|nr:MFS transporter [Leptospira sp. GIMC2001]WCL48533.1 MFS transporter [Leptospira sp. GIMC2001]